MPLFGSGWGEVFRPSRTSALGEDEVSVREEFTLVCFDLDVGLVDTAMSR